MKVFLSYTRNKDQFNKVSSFRDRLEQELSMRSPGATVFQDKRHLSDGQHFPEELGRALRQSDVFLALVSPAWLHSEWCRREFGIFTADATDPDCLRRILPVLWVDTPQLSPRSLDVVARTLANINYSDWRDLRYENWETAENQRQVGKLAQSAVALARSSACQLPTSFVVDPGIATAQRKAELAGDAVPSPADSPGELHSLRLQVLAVLGAESADLRILQSRIGIADGDPRLHLLSVVGKLVEDRVIEQDTYKPSGYYRLARPGAAK